MAQHEMTSLKRSRSENEDEPLLEGEDFFPLSLFLSDPEIKKLGLTGVEVGQELMLAARVKVTSISVNESEDSEKRESVTLVLIEGEVLEERDAADTLFG